MPHEATIPLGVRLPAPSSNLPGRTGRASLLPYLVLLQTGYAEHAVSPRHLVGSCPTVSPLPPAWRFAFCGAVRRSPFLDVIQRPALWSPDFPPRTCVRGGGPSGSRVGTGAENGSRFAMFGKACGMLQGGPCRFPAAVARRRASPPVWRAFGGRAVPRENRNVRSRR